MDKEIGQFNLSLFLALTPLISISDQRNIITACLISDPQYVVLDADGCVMHIAKSMKEAHIWIMANGVRATTTVEEI